MHEGTGGDGFYLVVVQVELLHVQHALEVVLQDCGDVVVSEVQVPEARHTPERVNTDGRDEGVGNVEFLQMLEPLEDRTNRQMVGMLL